MDGINKTEIENNFRSITRLNHKFKLLLNGFMYERMDYNFKPRQPEDKLYGMYSITFDEDNMIVKVFSNEYNLDSQVIISYNEIEKRTFDELYELIYNTCDDIHQFCLGRSKVIKDRSFKELNVILVKNGMREIGKYNPDNFDPLKGCRTAIENDLRNKR